MFIAPSLPQEYIYIIDPNALIAHIYRVENDFDARSVVLLASGLDGNEIVINWMGEDGVIYDVFSTMTLSAPMWSPEQEGLQGTGAPITLQLPVAETPFFVRVVRRN